MSHYDDSHRPTPYRRRETVSLDAPVCELDPPHDEMTVGGLLAVVELERCEARRAESSAEPEEASSLGLSLFVPDDGESVDADDAQHAANGGAVAHSPPRNVCEVMTPAPTCIAPEATILELVRLVHAKKFRHLLVADEERRLIGVVSDRDIVRCFGPGEFPSDAVLEQMRAGDIMSRDVVTVGPDASPADCIDKMHEHGINCLPVVVDGRPIGILTTADLLRLLRRILSV